MRHCWTLSLSRVECKHFSIVLHGQWSVTDIHCSPMDFGLASPLHCVSVQVAGGLLADTPGFNQPALEGVSPDALASYFPEIQDAIQE